MSLSLFNVYIMSVSERLSKCPDDKSKDDFLIDTIEKWKATCGVCDCMAMPDVVFEWERLIYQKMGPQRMFSYVIFIYKYTERFFPFFVGFVKFVRTVLMKNIMSNEQDVEDFLKTFAVMGRCRSQSLAFLLTNDRKYTKVALSLAVFDKDCPESEAIINSDPKLLELLASLNE